MIIRRLLIARPITPNLSPVAPFRSTLPIVYRARMSTTSPPQLQNILIQTEPGIAIIKYNRPKNGNALHTPTLKDILAALKWADQESSVRVIVTTGEGKFYTAGLDLLDPVNQGPESTISDEFIDTLRYVQLYYRYDSSLQSPTHFKLMDSFSYDMRTVYKLLSLSLLLI